MYAQPVRVVPNNNNNHHHSSSDHYDPSSSNIGYSTESIWNNGRNGRNSTRTISTANNNNKTSKSRHYNNHHIYCVCFFPFNNYYHLAFDLVIIIHTVFIFSFIALVFFQDFFRFTHFQVHIVNHQSYFIENKILFPVNNNI